MFGLTRDFMQQDGIYMMLGEPDGMSAAKLNMVQARMLMNTDIPHHLRLLLREIDLKVTLEYAVLRKKMLSHLLKSEKLTMTSFFSMLLQIAQGMEDGRLYMLRSEQYALHADYIFIEGSLQSGKVYLTYVPLQSNEPASKPGECFKSLIMVLMASITELTGSGVQRLLQYCGTEGFSPAGLKELLSELLTAGDSIRRQEEVEVRVRETVVRLNEPEPPAQAATVSYKQSIEQREAKLPPVQVKLPNFQFMQPNIPANPAPLLSRDSNPDLPQSTSLRTYFILGALLGDALLWKFLYLNHPQQVWLIACGIVTILLGVLCWMVWSGRLMLGGNKDEDEGELGEGAESEPMFPNRRELEWNFGRATVSSVNPATTEPKIEKYHPEPLPVVPSPRFDSRAEACTTVKAPEFVAPTTLLIREEAPNQGKVNEKLRRNVPYLSRCDEEDVEGETIELNHTSFIIGRSSEVAQYVERSEGASRVHAEISRGPSGYVLKDLDSRNGTIFQGEAMIPYKEYPLTEGTLFKIVKGSYTFHTA